MFIKVIISTNKSFISTRVHKILKNSFQEPRQIARSSPNLFTLFFPKVTPFDKTYSVKPENKVNGLSNRMRCS